LSRQILIATTSADKLREITAILADAPFELVSLADMPPTPAPEETGGTFLANARLKARYYAAATDLLTVAEDSGLEVDALDGAPGVESARWGGVDASYPQKFALIHQALHSNGATGSPARFVCAVALVGGNDILWETRASVEGTIAAEPRGSGGFGYDPIFLYPPFGCTFAEAGARKSEVSHRGMAFRALKEHLLRWRSE
jgi:XTP/dITP diphosphohydrolase